VVDQIINLLGGDHALAARVVAEMQTTPLTTFVTLLLQEEKKQTQGGTGQDSVVYDNQCKR